MNKLLNENDIATIIINTAFDLHQDLGPGMYESVYEVILAKMLSDKGLTVDRQGKIPLTYRGTVFEEAFRADLIVNNLVLVEIKAVDALTKSHRRQVVTYLRIANLKLGLLFNFNNEVLKNNFERIVNGLPEDENNDESFSLY